MVYNLKDENKQIYIDDEIEYFDKNFDNYF